MSHEPTDEEHAAYLKRVTTRGALTAANRIRDARIRAEALEEAAALFDGHEDHTAFAWIARAIRALKDKTDDAPRD